MNPVSCALFYGRRADIYLPPLLKSGAVELISVKTGRSRRFSHLKKCFLTAKTDKDKAEYLGELAALVRAMLTFAGITIGAEPKLARLPAAMFSEAFGTIGNRSEMTGSQYKLGDGMEADMAQAVAGAVIEQAQSNKFGRKGSAETEITLSVAPNALLIWQMSGPAQEALKAFYDRQGIFWLPPQKYLYAAMPKGMPDRYGYWRDNASRGFRKGLQTLNKLSSECRARRIAEADNSRLDCVNNVRRILKENVVFTDGKSQDFLPNALETAQFKALSGNDIDTMIWVRERAKTLQESSPALNAAEAAQALNRADKAKAEQMSEHERRFLGELEEKGAETWRVPLERRKADEEAVRADAKLMADFLYEKSAAADEKEKKKAASREKKDNAAFERQAEMDAARAAAQSAEPQILIPAEFAGRPSEAAIWKKAMKEAGRRNKRVRIDGKRQYVWTRG